MNDEHEPLTIEEYCQRRGMDDTGMDEARQTVRDYIRDYELREARQRRKLTQIALALRMKVSQKRISEIESGDISRLKIDTVRRYVEALDGKLKVVAELPDKTIPLLG